MDTKTRSLYMLSTRDRLKSRDIYRMKVKGCKKIFYANGDEKKAGVAILISDKIDFEIKAVKTDKEKQYIYLYLTLHVLFFLSFLSSQHIC